MNLCRLETIFIDTVDEDYEQYLFQHRYDEHVYDEEITQQRFEENLAEIQYEEEQIKHLLKMEGK